MEEWAVDRLCAEIRAGFASTRRLTGLDQPDPRVLAAIARVPRQRFVPPGLRQRAYVNHALPIGHGQTISQPYIVALMTSLLCPRPDQVVLEIGTGSGYQAAILAEVVGRVYSIEIVPALATGARDLLAELGYDNVEVACRDGAAGWPAHAPFDGILVTAAATDIPEALLEQLAPGGRLVAPLDRHRRAQDLVLVEKGTDGSLRERSVLEVLFVPLTHRTTAGGPGRGW